MTTAELTRNASTGVITINNPPVNALSQALRQDILDCLERANSDVHMEALVLRSAGRVFCAGADIHEFGEPPRPPLLPDVVERIEALSKPIIAAIHGVALGGGLEVAMACHHRVAGFDASLGLPEISLGLLPGATGTQRLPRLVGIGPALDMMLSGKPIGAEEAMDLGLVEAVANEEALLDCALHLARKQAGREPRRVSLLPVPAPEPGTFEGYRKTLAEHKVDLPAPNKIIDCVEAATRLDYQEACAFEREAFLECMASSQSHGLRHAFRAERQASKMPDIDATTNLRSVNKIAVIGAGTMGAGIAYAALSKGFRVHLHDADGESLKRGTSIIDNRYIKAVKRGKLSAAQAEAVRTRLSTGLSYDDIADAELVIEAVFEDMPVKKEVFRQLDDVCKPGAILASNTSTLDIDSLAAETSRPEDVIGLHFFSPAHVMRLLEIVRGEHTSTAVIASSMALAGRLDKIGVVVGNCYGFVGNRMLYSYGRENQMLLLEGAAPELIDQALTDWGMAMGPNAVGDLAGLDIGYQARHARDDLPDDPCFYRVADMLVEQGRLGQKTGAGIYSYAQDSRDPLPDPKVQKMIRKEARRLGVKQRKVSAEEIVERCIYALIVQGARILEEGIALRAGDIDVVWLNGYGFPRTRGGPMHYADRIGLKTVYETVCRLKDQFGEQYWQPPALLKTLAESGGSFADYSRS